MKIAFGIFGFIRIDIFKNEWLKFLEIFKNKDIIIDMYICVPTILNEFDDNDNVDFEYIKKTLLKEKIINNVYIKEYIYNANTFIKKSKEYNYVFKTTDHYLYPYRILSLFSSISNLSNEIIKSNIEYDFIILSRFDMLSLIKSIGNDIEKYKKKGSMYCIRNEKSLMFFEDRFTITHKDGLIILSQLLSLIHISEPTRPY